MFLVSSGRKAEAKTLGVGRGEPFLTLPKACEMLPLSFSLFCCHVDRMPLYLRARKGIKTLSNGYFYLNN